MNKGADIVLGARYDRIDTFYQSIANEGLARDRDAVLLYSNLYWGALTGNLKFLHQTNNVDDLNYAPTDRLRNASFSLSYNFNSQIGAKSWLGTPYINVSGFIANLDRKDTPIGYTGVDTNSASNSYTLGGGSNYETWYWTASHTFSEFEDDTNVASDTENNFTSLGAGWRVNKRLNFETAISYGDFHDKDKSTSSYDTTINLGIDAILIQDKLDVNFDYNVNLYNGYNDIPNTHIVNSELEYTFFQPAQNHPGIALAIRGAMEDTHDNNNQQSDEKDYQVFIILRVTAPFGYGY